MKTDDLGWGVRSDPPPLAECVAQAKKCPKVGEGGVLRGVPIKQKVLRITI